MSIVIHTEELRKMLKNESTVIIDVRTTGEETYKQSHIPKSLYLDVKEDLTGENSFLPNMERLANKLGDLGISNDQTIVLYDHGDHRAATKAWVILRYIGHDSIKILNGGFKAWTDAGNEVTNVLPIFAPTIYTVRIQKDIIVNMEQVKMSLELENVSLIDSRSHDRYTGKVEPTYKKGGHIPGAKNYHAKLVLNETGLWKTRKDLQEHFKDLPQNEEIMVSCGSGNSACLNLVALIEAGFENVKIYPGGFSEWIKDERNRVEKISDERNI